MLVVAPLPREIVDLQMIALLATVVVLYLPAWVMLVSVVGDPDRSTHARRFGASAARVCLVSSGAVVLGLALLHLWGLWRDPFGAMAPVWQLVGPAFPILGCVWLGLAALIRLALYVDTRGKRHCES